MEHSPSTTSSDGLIAAAEAYIHTGQHLVMRRDLGDSSELSMTAEYRVVSRSKVERV
jgi:hypothetical protein